MKKKILIFITFCLYSISSFAQNWEIAPQVGFNTALTYNRNYYTNFGFDLGATAAYNIKSFAIEADLIYSHIFKFGIGNDFISIPLKAKYYIVKGFNVFAGPQIDFYLNNRAFDIYYGGPGPDPHHVFFTVMGGLGYRFNKGFNISVSYNYKITQLYKDRAERMQGLKLSFARYFKLGKQ